MSDRISINTRSARTRAAIIEAFINTMFERRYDAIRVSDLITSAKVSKSTFYEHFRSKNDVMIVAMQPVVLALATAASGRAARAYVQNAVRHLWERRSIGRLLLGSVTTPLIQRRLAEAIRPHVERERWPADASSVLATGIAAAQLAMLRCWFAGEATFTVEDMTEQLVGCSRLYIGRQF